MDNRIIRGYDMARRQPVVPKTQDRYTSLHVLYSLVIDCIEALERQGYDGMVWHFTGADWEKECRRSRKGLWCSWDIEPELRACISGWVVKHLSFHCVHVHLWNILKPCLLATTVCVGEVAFKACPCPRTYMQPLGTWPEVGRAKEKQEDTRWYKQGLGEKMEGKKASLPW